MKVTVNWLPSQKREAFAQLGTVLAGIFIFALMKTMALEHDKPMFQNPISLTLIAPSAEPEKSIEPPVPKIPMLKPEKTIERVSAIMPLVQTPAPLQVAQAVQVTKALLATPAVNEKAATTEVATPIVAQPTRPASAEFEAMYVAKVRGYLVSAKRYPTGREASMRRPAGKVVVWFILQRNGELIDAGIETGSGSMLLDATALTTVRRASYTAFPDESWVGQSQHQFSVELNFIPPSS